MEDYLTIMEDYLTIRETAERAKNENIPLSEYAIRTLVKSGQLKAATVGRNGKVIIYYPNVIAFLRGGT